MGTYGSERVKLYKECISWVVRVPLRFNLRIVIHRRFGLGGRQKINGRIGILSFVKHIIYPVFLFYFLYVD